MLDALAAIAKALLYAGILSCAGAVFAEWALRNCASSISNTAIVVVRRGALLTIAASLVGAVILVFRLGAHFDAATLSAVFVSGFGAAMGLQVAGAALLLASPNDDSARGMRLSNAALMTLSFGFSGHAAASDFTDGLIAFIHASAAAWWVGSLWLLRHACVQLTPSEGAACVRRFGTLATGVIGGLVIAGLLLIRALVDFTLLPRLAAYEQVLFIKLAIVAVVLGVATYNKFRLTPQLAAGNALAIASLRRTINVELVLIGAVLAVTAILTTYTSPQE